MLQRDNWLHILGSFVHLEKVERIGKDGKKTTKEGLIFPRLHQWEAVNKLKLKLDNERYVQRAPAAVVQKDRERLSEMAAELERTDKHLAEIRKLAR